ncbi:lantibiotic immunity ABC transporter MutG family permease subunit [Anaerovorax odorimutans]|uniref:lantibiotic immunity ABC transporter MutG family permease subunit n=1 Tax=Anaerovorax odorimutans TaxID=109327 RepID=UPI00041B0168|nr:lantibiotic immunity ABC transporter MutG family permease subunit [Anaerovorax odorimutans]
MKQFVRCIKSDGFKVIHSALLFVHLLIPILGAAAFLAYYTVSLCDETLKVSAYLQVLSMAFPLLIGIITVMVAEQELQAGSFQLLLCAPGKKYIPHFGKLTVLLIFGLLSSFIAVFGFGIMFHAMGNVFFPISLYLKAAILLFLGNLPLYVLQYILSFAFGKGIGLGTGIVGSLLSALLLTGLGDRIWPFLPWSIATRFCSILVESKATNRLFLNNPGVDKGFLFILISSTILIIVLKLWSEKWEGRKNEAN